MLKTNVLAAENVFLSAQIPAIASPLESIALKDIIACLAENALTYIGKIWYNGKYMDGINAILSKGSYVYNLKYDGKAV